MSDTPPARDLLEKERRARQLLQAVSTAAAEAQGVDDALQAALDAICGLTGWPVGHVYAVTQPGELRSLRLWHLDSPERFQSLRRVSEATTFLPGQGLPGRVLASGEPIWIDDIARDSNFPRARTASDLGVQAGFGFPVRTRSGVWGVLEFFSPVAAPPDLPLLDVMATAGTQLGRAVERAAAQDALRESELRFRSVAETAADAIITTDDHGVVVSWNRAAERMFGRSAEEMRGQPLGAIIPERFRELHSRGMARRRRGEDARVVGRTVELYGLRADGTEFPLELSLAEWSLGAAQYFTGILRDISERRQSEARLKEIAERLAVSERRAIEASQAKTAFLASMSHELRTPLNAILGFVSLMQRDRNLTKDQIDNLKIIARGGEHLLGLINDVLSLSKIEAGEWQLHESAFDLGALIESLREMFFLRCEAKDLGLIAESAGIPRWVRGDEGKLRQILINLLGNAVKFTERGGIALRVRWSDGRCEFEVEDTGPGMSTEEQEGLFTPFVQAEAGQKAHEGTGLGLAISRRSVSLMGGELKVRSAPEKGSCFFFSVPLPASTEGPAPAKSSRVVRLVPGQHFRILVVDDADDNRRLLSRLLSGVGFEVHEAVDGEAALEAWRKLSPELIWMDMRMPRRDGYSATRELRRIESEQQLPRTVVLALTASAFEHDRSEILAAGCDDVLYKPFREEQIFEALERYLGARFEHEDQEVRNGAPASSVADGLRRVPARLLDALHQALADGDDLAAGEVVEQIASVAASIADELRPLVRSFQMNELLHILEKVRS